MEIQWVAIGFTLAIMAGIWTYFDARDKGRTTSEAFMWGFGVWAFLILFLPIWILARRAVVKPQEEEDDRIVLPTHLNPDPPLFYPPSRVWCENCGKQLSGSSNFCSGCGKLVPKHAVA